MALHDVSKDDNTRLDPKANASDTRAQRDAHGTNSVNYTTDASAASNTAVLGGNARLVKTGTANVVISGTVAATLNVVTTTITHNLGYAPLAIAALNGASVLGGPSNVNFFLPSWLAASHSGNDLTFQVFMGFQTDPTSLYITTLVGGNAFEGTTYTVTYYLYQQTVA